VLPASVQVEAPLAPVVRRSRRASGATKQTLPSGQNVTFAHELRRRLAALRVLGEAIQVRTSEDDIDRLVHMLVSELHDLEELESTMLGAPKRETLEDVDVLGTAQAAAQTVSLARNSHIRVDGSRRALRIRSNPTMLRQALENLMDNAATCGLGNPVDVVVRFSVSRRLPGIEVLVADRGPGLGRAPANRRSGGVGLQLVRKFVQEAGGRLWFKDREGGGALFGLWLPAGSITLLSSAIERDEVAQASAGGRA
jgi:signal transduction histidine kinase